MPCYYASSMFLCMMMVWLFLIIGGQLVTAAPSLFPKLEVPIEERASTFPRRPSLRKPQLSPGITAKQGDLDLMSDLLLSLSPSALLKNVTEANLESNPFSNWFIDEELDKELNALPACQRECVRALYDSLTSTLKTTQYAEKYHRVCRSYKQARKCVAEERERCGENGDLFEVMSSGLHYMCVEQGKAFNANIACIEREAFATKTACDEDCFNRTHFLNVLTRTTRGELLSSMRSREFDFAFDGSPTDLEHLEVDPKTGNGSDASFFQNFQEEGEDSEACAYAKCMLMCFRMKLNSRCEDSAGALISETLVRPLVKAHEKFPSFFISLGAVAPPFCELLNRPSTLLRYRIGPKVNRELLSKYSTAYEEKPINGTVVDTSKASDVDLDAERLLNAIYTKGTFEQEYEAGSFNASNLSKYDIDRILDETHFRSHISQRVSGTPEEANVLDKIFAKGSAEASEVRLLWSFLMIEAQLLTGAPILFPKLTVPTEEGAPPVPRHPSFPKLQFPFATISSKAVFDLLSYAFLAPPPSALVKKFTEGNMEPNASSKSWFTGEELAEELNALPACQRECVRPLYDTLTSTLKTTQYAEKHHRVCRSYKQARKCVAEERGRCGEDGDLFEVMSSGLHYMCVEQGKAFIANTACIEREASAAKSACLKKCFYDDFLNMLAQRNVSRDFDANSLQNFVEVRHEACTEVECILLCFRRQLNSKCEGSVGALISEAVVRPLVTAHQKFPSLFLALDGAWPPSCGFLYSDRRLLRHTIDPKVNEELLKTYGSTDEVF